MEHEELVGLDSQCLSYLIDAMGDIEAPKDDIAIEKVALFRTYLYTPGTLWATPTVTEECGRIRHEDRRQLHESYLSVLIGEWQIENPEQTDARVAQLRESHAGESDCRILAEAEAAGFSVLLTYDDKFLRRLRNRSSTVALRRPAEHWGLLGIRRGTKPDKVPHPTNPLVAETWWQW